MESKLIHCNIFEPCNSLFKSAQNNAAEVQTISCSNSNNCGFFKREECLLCGVFSKRHCLYGQLHRDVGFTRKALKYYSWIKTQKERYKGIPFLKEPSRISVVGDYVSLPYLYLDLHKLLPFSNKISLSVKKEDFTIENINKIIHFIPRTLLVNEEIKEYQKEIIPKFLKHLSEELPDLFNQVITLDEYAKKRFAEFTNIGRKAILETTTPNVGEFKDIHGGLWQWDGKTLKSTNSHASFLLISKFKELIVIPDEKQVIVITEENQVNENTVFVE